MKNILILLFVLCSLSVSAKTGGGALIPSCMASPPSQASSAGITKLVMCDTFSTNQVVDANASGNAGLDWYAAPVYTGFSTNPPTNITNDGTGASLVATASGNGGRVLQTAGYKSTSPNYIGTVIGGSFYAEIDAKFNGTVPTGQPITTNWPSFWMQGIQRYVQGTLGGAVPSTTEVDFFEAYPNSGVGNPIQFRSQFVHWVGAANIGSSTSDCSGNPPSAPGVTYSNYNTYGVLVIKSSDNGGTGILKTYVNNVLSASCTYTSGGTPSCTAGITGTCATGAVSELDTQQSVIMLSAGNIASAGITQWPTTVANFHVWQKP